MSDKVIVSKSKPDTLADTIKSKSGATDNLTLDELVQKVNNIETGSSGSERWEWVLNNIGNFSSANPKFFKGNTYLKVMPNYFNEECAKITDWSNAFEGCSNLVDVDIDTSAGTNFNSTFKSCTQLTDESIKNLNFNNMINGFAMFGYGTKIIQLPKFNHDTITNMGEMFWSCSLSDLGIEDLNFPNVTNAAWTFGQTQITTVPNLSFPKTTTAQGIFQSCANLTTIGDLKLDVCTNIDSGFYDCTKLRSIGVLSIPKVQTFNKYVFHNCKALESIKQFNVSPSATSLPPLTDVVNLKSIDFVNSTSNINDFSGLFAGKTALETVKGLDLSSATNVSNMFLGCSNLKNATFVANSIKISLDLRSSSLLSDESIESLKVGLATVETTQDLTIHNDVNAKLTDEQRTNIQSKNWNIVVPVGRAKLEVTNANTLIATIGGRDFTKTNDGLAIACTAKFGNYTGILLVSKYEEAVKYKALGHTVGSAGHLTYNNDTYYYSGRDWFMRETDIVSVYLNMKDDISGKTYTNDNAGSEEASTDLLNYYFNE